MGNKLPLSGTMGTVFIYWIYPLINKIRMKHVLCGNHKHYWTDDYYIDDQTHNVSENTLTYILSLNTYSKVYIDYFYN